MVRTIVQVIQVRMSDVMSGDIINKNADDPRGWFMVKDIQPLPNGDIAVPVSYTHLTLPTKA